MKRSEKLYFFYTIIIIFAGIILSEKVQADTFYVYRDPDEPVNQMNTTLGYDVPIPIYHTVSNGIDTETYCVDPGLYYAGNGYYTVNRYIDPRTDAPLDKAVAAAVYEMHNRRENGLDDTSYTAVGQIVMRWIFRQYNDGGNFVKDGYMTDGVYLEKSWIAFGNPDYATALNNNSAIVTIAKEVYSKAMEASRISYNQAVEQNLIYNPRLTAKYKEVINGSKRTWTITIQSSEEKYTPEKLGEYASYFTIACSNTSVTCSVNTAATRVEGNSVVMELNIDTTNWNKQDFGVKITPEYCDLRDVTTQFLLLISNQTQRQKMVTILNYCTPTPFIPHDEPGFEPDPDYSESCICEVDSSGKYTGKYIYEKLQDGNRIEYDIFTALDTEKVTQYGCPVCEEITERPGNSCACIYNTDGSWSGHYSYIEWRWLSTGNIGITSSQILNQNQITSDMNCPPCPSTPPDDPGSETKNQCACAQSPNGDWYYQYLQYRNGQIFNQIEFPLTDQNQANAYNCPSAEECTSGESHICEIENGQHYCEDGEPCSEEEYLEQCGCREENGNYYCEDGESCSFDEYKEQCLPTNCYPTVTIPSDCQDINSCSDGDKFGEYNGLVSDINQIETSCNPDTNQVKSCVIDNNDLLNNSFDATEYEMGYDNPYCSVWCNETYEFQLPTAQYTMSGGYFTLSLAIKGTRDCYISGAENPEEGIDREKFNQDLTSAQHAVVDAWNEYNKWKEAVETGGNEVYHDDTHSSSSSSDCGCENDCDTEDPTCSPSSACPCDGDSTTDSYYTYSWTYTVYDYAGNDSQRTETASSGTAGSCPSSCCDGECTDGEKGTSQKDTFKTNRDNALNTLKSAITALNTIIRQYNDCTGAVTNSDYMTFLSGIVSDTANSTGWNNNMKFDPQVEFTYYEDYLRNINGTFSGNGASLETNYYVCTGEVDEKYENCTNTSYTTSNTSSYTTTQNVTVCNDDSCSVISINVSQANRIKISKTYEDEYHSDTDFSTYTQYGTVTADPNGPDSLWTTLPDDAFPISLIRKTGVFPFKFTFSDIGQYNNGSHAGELGRLMDGENRSVITEIDSIPSYYQCNADGIESPTTTGGYVCHYVNNCPGCDFTCEDGKCTIDEPECEDGECIVRCDDNNNCVFIFDGENATYTYRIVSLNNLFPNEERGAGYNWSEANEKAAQTREEIERTGESAYEEAQYSFTLSPSNLQHIREYNKEVGSYTNTTTTEGKEAITCDTVTYKSIDLNGKTNEVNYNVRCQSSFLDLIESSGNRYATNVVRPDPASSWTLYEVENGTYSYGIGPAWK